MLVRSPAAPPTYAVLYDPATVLLASSVALSAVGAVQQGRVAKSQAKTQSAILRQQADRERQVAASNEEDFRRSQDRLLAARRAAAGASGVEQSTGSPLLAAEDFASEVELNALRIRSGGEVRATRLQQQAGLVRQQGSAASRAGFIRGGSLLARGGARILSGKGKALS